MSAILLYADISHDPLAEFFGWCYIIVEDGKILVGPRTGIRRRSRLVNPELYPVSLGLRGFGGAVPMVDYLDGIPGAVLVNKRDPWHLVCHYAARDVVARKRRTIPR